MKTTGSGSRGRNARGEASLQRILDATVELVGRYGYDNTTIARITKATQRPASSIYWYFEDKNDLIATALESSYSGFTRTGRPWQNFDTTAPLPTQLTEEFGSQLRASESEAPLRLGIMLALEGSAAQSKVQEPFRRRRANALQWIEKWWNAAFDEHRTNDDQRERGTWWMSTLTLAFLDGHYISDVITDESAVAARSRIVALCLTSAFDAVRASATHRPATSPDSLGLAEGFDGADPEPNDLLRVTRELVAQHGYEGATIGRICASTGMQRSSVYWRHKDKDALIRAAVAGPYVSLFSPYHCLPTSTDRWAGDLAAALVTVIRAAQTEPSTIKAGLLLEVQKRDPQTSGGAAVLAGTAAAEAALADWFAAVVPERNGESLGDHLAWTVMRLTEGLMFGSVAGRPLAAETMYGLLEAAFDGVVERWPATI